MPLLICGGAFLSLYQSLLKMDITISARTAARQNTMTITANSGSMDNGLKSGIKPTDKIRLTKIPRSQWEDLDSCGVYLLNIGNCNFLRQIKSFDGITINCRAWNVNATDFAIDVYRVISIYKVEKVTNH